jgi:hypothetical protein
VMLKEILNCIGSVVGYAPREIEEEVLGLLWQADLIIEDLKRDIERIEFLSRKIYESVYNTTNTT